MTAHAHGDSSPESSRANRPSLIRAEAARRRVAPIEGRALGVLAAASIVTIALFIVPIGIGILLGWLFACGLHRRYQALSTKRGNATLLAVGFAAVATLVVGSTLMIIGYLLIVRGALLFDMLPAALAPGGGLARFLDSVAKPLAPLGVSGQDLLARVQHALGGAESIAASAVTQLASITLKGFLALFFMAVTTFHLLLNWNALAHRVERMLPLNPHHTRALLRELRRLGSQTIFGTIAAGLAQGVLAGIGFALAGVPDAAFFGAMTAVCSLLPVVGTLLVWVPAASWLVATGHHGAGAFLFAWGALAIVAFCDYVVRPKLVGSDRMSLWMTFISLFGGLELFGFVGLLIGPVIVGIALALLRLYERERQFRLRAS